MHSYTSTYIQTHDKIMNTYTGVYLSVHVYAFKGCFRYVFLSGSFIPCEQNLYILDTLENKIYFQVIIV